MSASSYAYADETRIPSDEVRQRALRCQGLEARSSLWGPGADFMAERSTKPSVAKAWHV